jgi:hypothetical protein
VACLAQPDVIDLCRKRGDSFADEFTIKDKNKVVIDISGFSFLLTVDPSPTPADAANNIFQLTGVITDAVNGKVEFAPTTTQSDVNPQTYFYDIQQTDGAGRVRTIAEGPYDITQDVTK